MQTDTPTTLPLFTAEQLPPPPAPPRPKRSDPAVLDAAVELLWPSVLAWLSRDEPCGEDEHAEAKAELRERIGWYSDGYELARALDDWDPDADLVEILDAADHRVYQAHSAAVEAWVAKYGIATPLTPGTRVKAKTGGRVVEGEIAASDKLDSYTKRAQYLVFVAAEGHVRSGLGTHGFIVDAEDVEPIAGAPPTGPTAPTPAEVRPDLAAMPIECSTCKGPMRLVQAGSRGGTWRCDTCNPPTPPIA